MFLFVFHNDVMLPRDVILPLAQHNHFCLSLNVTRSESKGSLCCPGPSSVPGGFTVPGSGVGEGHPRDLLLLLKEAKLYAGLGGISEGDWIT